jgi:hypothetical protein
VILTLAAFLSSIRFGPGDSVLGLSKADVDGTYPIKPSTAISVAIESASVLDPTPTRDMTAVRSHRIYSCDLSRGMFVVTILPVHILLSRPNVAL